MKSPINDEISNISTLDGVNTALDKINTVITNFLNTKDSFLDNDYIEFIGDTFKIVGVAKNLCSLASQKKFEWFLNGFKDIETPTEKQLEKLLKYIDNEEKAQFIADTFSKLLLSKSKKSCLIMGSLMKKFIDDNHKLTHFDLIYINALPDLFDQDIINFKFICDFINNNPKSKYMYCYSKEFREKCTMLNIDLASINLTLEKCVSLQLLLKSFDTEVSDIDTEWNSASAETSEYCNIAKPGQILYEYIKNLIK